MGCCLVGVDLLGFDLVGVDFLLGVDLLGVGLIKTGVEYCVVLETNGVSESTGCVYDNDGWVNVGPESPVQRGSGG